MKSVGIVALAIVLVILGALTVNYTKPSKLERHQQWASETGAPPPSDAILAGGIVCLCAGVGLLARTFRWPAK